MPHSPFPRYVNAARSTPPLLGRHDDTTFSCGDPHVPFSARGNEDSSRQHPISPGCTMRFLSCLTATQSVGLHKHPSINADYRNIFTFPTKMKLQQDPVCQGPAHLDRSQADPKAITHVSEAHSSAATAAEHHVESVFDSIW